MTPLPRGSLALPVRHPGRFVLTFAVLAGLLMILWSHLSGYYLAGLAALANLALSAGGVPVGLNVPVAASREIVHPAVVGAMALFAATPDRSWRWKAIWLATVLVGLSLLHTSLLVSEIWQLHARATPMGGTTTSSLAPAALLLGLAREWGPPLAVVTSWFAAVRRDHHPVPVRGTAPSGHRREVAAAPSA